MVKKYEAMWIMLQHSAPDDFVVASGVKHTVREFFDVACSYLDLNPDEIILQNKKYLRPIELNRLIGDASKAKHMLNWQAKTTFRELVCFNNG